MKSIFLRFWYVYENETVIFEVTVSSFLSFHYRRFHRLDRRQEICEQFPTVA